MSFTQEGRIGYMRFGRQASRCAYCGRLLKLEEYSTNADGSWDVYYLDGDPENHKLSNCAVLCSAGAESCYNIASSTALAKSRFRLTRKGF